MEFALQLFFNKPFAVYINKDRGASRFYSLLKLLHLEERIIDSEEKLEVLLLKNKEISYENVNVLLEKEKERCISWLKKCNRESDSKTRSFRL
ncbi:hypothetical protein [Clostridium sp. AF21-20LB]|uniref:hypothetical protein n=1 Tax=Clostridium sp. AF21-20LB TaxID=2293003 RepID=UPI0011C24003